MARRSSRRIQGRWCRAGERTKWGNSPHFSADRPRQQRIRRRHRSEDRPQQTEHQQGPRPRRQDRARRARCGPWNPARYRRQPRSGPARSPTHRPDTAGATASKPGQARGKSNVTAACGSIVHVMGHDEDWRTPFLKEPFHGATRSRATATSNMMPSPDVVFAA